MQYISNGAWKGKLGIGLAERELSCLLAVAAGHTDKEIAKHDGLSPRSVKGRIESCMHKLGVYKRPALVAEAFRRGLISPAAALAFVLAAHGALAEDPMTKLRRSGGSESKIETRIAAKRHEIALAA
ncbi:LuxR family transcriptional regulator [Pseudomonas syringae pv. delphinii]|uniref:LuxR family transcriptional regulator n=1 Tax=Pseudomonas syringae pv. delphinii TaxID=192088 RepID=A0A0N8RGH8_9PSED|nr:LuxR C-terminal-related transcriptional regulator [Pseudomonas syringae group genomosp. 3]KPX26031.1 LuxR family transcriptional regulator [Pseudomonas syringae pv. delphinii]RMP18268.1 LuxR family transcriptional regulator [Pseudomonas syringae pv. delphinii]RMQ27819.1 LuxR family transcriptional regulator [Pseudomonas syringae pv. delphinii]